MERNKEYSAVPLSPTAPPSDGTLGHAPPRRHSTTSAVIAVASWLSLSMLLVVFNKYILNEFAFRFPILLTIWHMLCATIGTRYLARTSYLRPELERVGPVDVPKQIVPIALMFSLAIGCSNAAYLTLGLGFIQMLKALIPVAVFLAQWAASSPKFAPHVWPALAIISGGIMVTSVGELNFVWAGFLFQSASLGAEAFRVILIEKLLEDRGMKPLTLLYYVAPVSLGINSIAFLFVEAYRFNPSTLPEHSLLSWVTVFGANAVAIFFLNIASLTVIEKASALILAISGVGKDVILVTFSSIVLGEHVSALQLFGYSVTIGGMGLFRKLSQK